MNWNLLLFLVDDQFQRCEEESVQLLTYSHFLLIIYSSLLLFIISEEKSVQLLTYSHFLLTIYSSLLLLIISEEKSVQLLTYSHFLLRRYSLTTLVLHFHTLITKLTPRRLSWHYECLSRSSSLDLYSFL